MYMQNVLVVVAAGPIAFVNYGLSSTAQNSPFYTKQAMNLSSNSLWAIQDLYYSASLSSISVAKDYSQQPIVF